MSTKIDLASVEAKQGERMIEVKLCFWTDEISSEKGKIIPKHAWASGVVRIERNRAHNIEPLNPRPFNSLFDVGSAIEKVLIEHGIVLHPTSKMRKYISED